MATVGKNKKAGIIKTPAKVAVRVAPKAAKKAAPRSTPPASLKKTSTSKVTAGAKPKKQIPQIPVKKGTASPTKVTSIFATAELEVFRAPLIKMREQINRRIHAVANDSLKNVDDTPSEDRTDDFDREFALNLVSSEHDVLFEIDDALRRIQMKTYGQCDGCGKRVENIRLRALPFARMCVKCQSESERGRSRFRPFGETLAQGTEAAAEPGEVEETE